jgi:exosortase E/protease (VPEID-CTERM system)
VGRPPDRAPNSTEGFWRVARWAVLLVLLLGEVLLLTLRFDVETITAEDSWWAQSMYATPRLLRCAIAIVSGILLLCGDRLWSRLRREEGPPATTFFWTGCLLAHLGLFGAFFFVSRVVFEGADSVAGPPALWALAWWCLGTLSVVSWGLTALPGRTWLRLVQHAPGGILSGACLGAAGWAAGELAVSFWEPLGFSTLWSAHKLLACFYPDAFYRASDFVVGTPSFDVTIAPECSGYEGMGLIAAFLAVYLMLFRRSLRMPQALLLFPLGLGLSWVLNVVRIAALVALGTSGWPEVAQGGFHSQAGWLAFNAVALGLVAVSGHIPFFSGAPVSALRTPGPSTAYLAPFLVALAMTMIAGALSGAGGWLYPLRVIAVAGTLLFFRTGYAPDLRWTWSWQPAVFGVAACALWVVLIPQRLSAGQVPLDLANGSSGQAVLGWCFRIIGYVLITPLAEELAFRGYLTRRLMAADFHSLPAGRFSWLSFIGSSVLFGALHGQHWLAGTLAGMLFALALYRRGRLADAVAAHATANGLLALYAVATGRWELWS